MEPLNPKKKHGPEYFIQEAIIKMLRYREWYVKRIPGSGLLSGMPDLFACHRRYGPRWIEVKDPNRTGEVFTKAQRDNFPLMQANGAGVWVLTGAKEADYKLLFRPPNWFTFLQVLR